MAMRVSKEQLLELAKCKTVLLRSGAMFINLAEASREWIERLPDIGEYEVREQDGMLVAQYIG